MKVDQFFLKVTTRGKISLRDIAHKITFFQSLARFISLKRLLLRTFRCKHRQIMQYLILSFSSCLLNNLLNYDITSLLSITFLELKCILNGIIRIYGETM